MPTQPKVKVSTTKMNVYKNINDNGERFTAFEIKILAKERGLIYEKPNNKKTICLCSPYFNYVKVVETYVPDDDFKK